MKVNRDDGVSIDAALETEILQQVKDKIERGLVKLSFRPIGPPPKWEAVMYFHEDYCKSPHIAPACNRRISRTWCQGECIGQSCIFWGSEGIGIINLERINNES